MGGDASSLDDNTDDNDEACKEHAGASSPGINGGTDEGNSDNTADLVHRGDDTCDLVRFIDQPKLGISTYRSRRQRSRRGRSP